MKPIALARTLMAGLALGALAAGAVQAQPAAAETAVASAAATRAPVLDIGQIHERLLAQGWRDVREIEWSKGRYKVKAHDSQGRRVKLYVSASTGEIEHSRVQDARH